MNYDILNEIQLEDQSRVAPNLLHLKENIKLNIPQKIVVHIIFSKRFLEKKILKFMLKQKS